MLKPLKRNLSVKVFLTEYIVGVLIGVLIFNTVSLERIQVIKLYKVTYLTCFVLGTIGMYFMQKESKPLERFGLLVMKGGLNLLGLLLVLFFVKS